jgi:hypothetical protein
MSMRDSHGEHDSQQVTLVKSAHPEAAQPAASAASSRPSTITTSGARENGYIATLRDNFGFLMCVIVPLCNPVWLLIFG